MNVKASLLEKFHDGSFALMDSEEIAKKLRLKRREALALRDILLSLCRSGELLCDLRGRFGTAEQFCARKGTFTGNERGFGFFTPDDGGEDLFIPRRASKGALHRDIVLAFRTAREGDEGEILQVLTHGISELVGVFTRTGKGGFVLPDERKLPLEIPIPPGKTKGATSGEKVNVAIFDGKNGLVGEVIECLGRAGDFFTEELALIRSHSIREVFPEDVQKEAEAALKKEIQKEIPGRTDLRDLLLVTVDGEDTRDIDDAISLSLENGIYTLGVHIADVSHYVRRGSALDREAFLRGTSVYFPDRVYPMLPKELSNGVCSLNEGEDRLALSCVMKIDGKGNLLHGSLLPSVIRSRRRMTYTEVTRLIEEGGNRTDLLEMLKNAAKLTEILQRKRRTAGCVELDEKETKILWSESKIEVFENKRTISHEMIEQFMVLANECVAKIMTEKQSPFIYRVHESPSEEKAAEFAAFLAAAGVKAEFNPYHVSPQDYQSVLNKLEGSPLRPVVSRVMLRSMMKAKYSSENVGHFGLSSECYCHFTSPIRRYPDLCVHRIIKDSLQGMKKTALEEKYAQFVKDASLRSSACEKNAAEAERDVDALFIAAYMQEKIGEEAEAVVSGVGTFGLYAELENSVEGFIALETLPEDSYEFLEERKILKGVRHSYRLGERLLVRVAGVDWGTRKVLFTVSEVLP